MKLPSFVTKAAFEVGKHSPAILVGVGVVGVVASAVGACVATRKVDDILEKHRADMKEIEEVKEYPDPKHEGEMIIVDEKERKNLVNGVKLKTALEFVKIYGLPVLGMILSIACILGAQAILRKRNAVLTAALASTTKAFDEYRKRVSGRFGEEVERQIRYNMQPNGDPVTVVDMDENGKSHKSKIQPMAIDMTTIQPDDNLIYFVRGYSKLWRDSDTYNENVINTIIADLQDEYSRKHTALFRNDISKVFQADGTAGGQALGYNYKDGDSLDITYTKTDFIDPITNGLIQGYVIELNGMHNILNSAFEVPKKSLVAFG